MNDYSSLRKQNNGTMPAVIALVLCVVLSATVLFSRLVSFSAADPRLYIPLTESGGLTTVLEGTRDENGDIIFAGNSFNRANHMLLTAQPSIRYYDNNTVWDGKTDLNIFSITYENGAQQVTVNGGDEKVIAPGTDNAYEFGLENTGKIPLDYNVTFNAVCEIIDKDAPSGKVSTFEIPVYASIAYTKDAADHYLFGDAENYVHVNEMVDVKHSGSVAAGKYIPYTLNWMWPFELDDELDTRLGNMASDLELEGKEIRLTITIHTYAEQAEDPDTDDGIPKTGDDRQVLVFGGLMAASALMLVFLLLPRRRREEANG